MLRQRGVSDDVERDVIGAEPNSLHHPSPEHGPHVNFGVEAGHLPGRDGDEQQRYNENHTNIYPVAEPAD